MDPQNNQNEGQNQAPQNVSKNNDTLMGVLSYLGLLVIISYFVAKDNQFVKFHVKQGLVLFGIEVIAWLLGSMLGPLYMLINIVNLATLVLSIVGIVNVVKGKQKELPIIGKFAQGLNI